MKRCKGDKHHQYTCTMFCFLSHIEKVSKHLSFKNHSLFTAFLKIVSKLTSW